MDLPVDGKKSALCMQSSIRRANPGVVPRVGISSIPHVSAPRHHAGIPPYTEKPFLWKGVPRPTTRTSSWRISSMLKGFLIMPSIRPSLRGSA